MGANNQPPNRVKMQATDLLNKLKEAKDNEEHVYILRDTDIVGGLDLSNRTVEIALDMQGCRFFGEVDLRYCECKQVVDFSRCIFHEGFLAGDENGSHTVFRKDLICNRAVFGEAARFRGARCEGKALFRRACFYSPGDDVDFGGASFEQALDYEKAKFCSGAKFNLVRCGVASFRSAEFKGETKLIDFKSASFKYLDCSDATFEGPVSLNGIECAAEASFQRATFKGKESMEDADQWLPFVPPPIDFTAASFKYLDCSGATFEGPTSFNGVECTVSASFGSAEFTSKRHLSWLEASADFTAASFKHLDCSGATFEGPTSFNGVECTVNASFGSAEFKGEAELVDFATASFKYLDCSGATFNGPVRFYGSTCTDGASFGRAQFMREFIRENCCLWPRSADLDSNGVHFGFTHFGSNLDLTSAYLQRAVTAEEARISNNLVLTASQFEDSFSLYSTKIGRIVLKNTLFKEKSLDLRECTFEWFTGTDEQARALVKNQDPIKLSMAPYLQLEKHYIRIGDEAKARVIYREGRHQVRKNAKTVLKKPRIDNENTEPENSHAQWPWQRHLSDWILDHLTGYGVQTWRLFLGALFFIVVGTAVFAWSDNALVGVEPSASSVASGATLVASTASVGEQSTYEQANKLFVYLLPRLAYSLDLFLPVVNLGLDEQWEPNGTVPEAYAYVHVFFGWLLVPLLVASLAGIIKRQG